MFREFHTLGATAGKVREEKWLVVAAVIRLKLIVDFLSAGIREDYWKGTPAVPTDGIPDPTRYSLFVLKVPLNNDQPTNLIN